ncbi:MAG: hypothetical protein QOF72_1022 [Blastocatellia bacterium]|jgi:hypothetical protein|nr:hypothetical protein [Blastocatellia bacterium]
MRARGPGGQSLAEGTVCARLYRGCPSSNRAADHLVRSLPLSRNWNFGDCMSLIFNNLVPWDVRCKSTPEQD